MATGLAEQGHTSHRDNLSQENPSAGYERHTEHYAELKRQLSHPALAPEQVAKARLKLRIQRIKRRRRERVVLAVFALLGSVGVFWFFDLLV